MEPRKPTEKEKEELFAYLISEEGFGLGMVTEEEVKEMFAEWMNTAPAAVFAISSGYAEKVLVILPKDAPLSPGVVEVYIWHEGKITRMRNEEDKQRS